MNDKIERCEKQRHVGVGQPTQQCLLTLNHVGDHLFAEVCHSCGQTKPTAAKPPLTRT